VLQQKGALDASDPPQCADSFTEWSVPGHAIPGSASIAFSASIMASASYYNQQQPPPQAYQMQPPQGGYYNNQPQYQPPYNNGYGQPQHQPPPGPPPGPPPVDPKANGYGAPTFDQAFAIQKPKWNDTWAGILFLLTCAGFTAVSAISIQGYGERPFYAAGDVPELTQPSSAATRGVNSGGLNGQLNSFSLTTHTIWLFAWVLCTAIVLSWVYVWLARMFTKQFIWITGILNIVFGLATAIYMLYRKFYSGGIVFLIFVGFLIFAFITWIPRIPFSALMLQTSIDVAKKYGHVFLVSAIGGLLATAFVGATQSGFPPVLSFFCCQKRKVSFHSRDNQTHPIKAIMS
jgi:hypothetical protein